MCPTRDAVREFVEVAIIYVLTLRGSPRDYGSYGTTQFDNVTSLKEYVEIACDHVLRVMKDYEQYLPSEEEYRDDHMCTLACYAIGGMIPISSNLHGDDFEDLTELFWKLPW